MLVGFNHNITYKGVKFHIQTEDSGVKNPHIITLLYIGGNIISSKKTSYADIVKMDNLDQVVEELMKEQHKEMLRRLKGGEFDTRLGLTGIPVATPTPEKAPAQDKAESLIEIIPAAPQKQKQSLDEIIFDFLTSGDEKK